MSPSLWQCWNTNSSNTLATNSCFSWVSSTSSCFPAMESSPESKSCEGTTSATTQNFIIFLGLSVSVSTLPPFEFPHLSINSFRGFLWRGDTLCDSGLQSIPRNVLPQSFRTCFWRENGVYLDATSNLVSALHWLPYPSYLQYQSLRDESWSLPPDPRDGE